MPSRPLSITIFATLFAAACLLSLCLAYVAAGVRDYGFALDEAAATQLSRRILWIRLVGLGFALALFVLVVAGRSRSARGALALRWVLGLATSIAFLRGVGVLAPGELAGSVAVAASVTQLSFEGAAILLLYGDDATLWFERPRRHG